MPPPATTLNPTSPPQKLKSFEGVRGNFYKSSPAVSFSAPPPPPPQKKILILDPPTPPVANPSQPQFPQISKKGVIFVKQKSRPFLPCFYRFSTGIKNACRWEVLLCTATDSLSPS